MPLFIKLYKECEVWMIGELTFHGSPPSSPLCTNENKKQKYLASACDLALAPGNEPMLMPSLSHFLHLANPSSWPAGNPVNFWPQRPPPAQGSPSSVTTAAAPAPRPTRTFPVGGREDLSRARQKRSFSLSV